MTVGQAIHLAIEHLNADRLPEAEQLYRQVLAVAPDHPEALHWLGTIALRCGAVEQAYQLIARAVKVSPDYPEALCSLGDVLASTGKPAEAVDAYRRALSLRPHFVEACNNLGTVLTELGRRDEAMIEYRKAQSLQPDSPQPWCNISQALLDEGKPEDALEAARQSLTRDPNFPDAHNNAAAALLRQGRYDDALAGFRRAIELRDAFPLARANLGMLLLLQGNFENGWREYEWRIHLPTSYKFRHDLAQPRWNGEDVSGKTLLLHSEQGFGDVIQFARYIPMVAGRGARVIVGCQPELVRLIRRIPGVSQCITAADPLPHYDLHCPLMSLPSVFGTTLATIPSNVPYIHPDAAGSEEWQSRLASHPLPKIGLAWAGRPEHTNDRNRSIPLNLLSPLLERPDLHWISLQKGAPDHPLRSRLTDWTAELTDFDDTAGLIAQLDLVITVDTAIAHLAGAMGKPVLVLLPFVPDWRWMLEREDSPWYPTMKLFRQTTAGEWESVVGRVKEELELWGEYR